MAGFRSSVGVSFSPKQVQTPDGKSDKDSVGLHQPPICPQCNSTRAWKDGLRYNGNAVIQRWLCRDCGYRFSDPIQSDKKENQHTLRYQVCVADGATKNLDTIETRTQEKAAGATNDTQLFNYAWELKKQGLKESSIQTYTRYLSALKRRGANLLDPESVKDAIAHQEWNENTRSIAVKAYSKFLEFAGGKWTPPKTTHSRKIPFIPLERELDQLIGGAYRKMAAFLQLLKETGFRSGEAWSLEWTDIDFEVGTIILNKPEKYGKPRTVKSSSTLIAMLNSLQKESNRIFQGDLYVFRRTFRKYRKRMAQKLQNPRLNRITFHTFRHWKATMEYNRTKDILYVMEILGHRDIRTTLIYTQLVNFEGDNYHVKAAKTLKEDEELLKAGFEYVTERDGIKIYRKRK
jgi:integrase